MDKEGIKKIVVSHIERNFPEYKGIEPEIQEEMVKIEDTTFAKAEMIPLPPKKVYVAVIKKEMVAENRGKIKSVIRITLDREGKIIKTTHSK